MLVQSGASDLRGVEIREFPVRPLLVPQTAVPGQHRGPALRLARLLGDRPRRESVHARLRRGGQTRRQPDVGVLAQFPRQHRVPDVHFARRRQTPLHHRMCLTHQYLQRQNLHLRHRLAPIARRRFRAQLFALAMDQLFLSAKTLRQGIPRPRQGRGRQPRPATLRRLHLQILASGRRLHPPVGRDQRRRSRRLLHHFQTLEHVSSGQV